MPRASTQQDGLLDTWGRKNRRHADRACANCGKTFRPRAATSKYCSRQCLWANNGGHNKVSGPTWWRNSRGYIEGRIWQEGKRVRVKQHRWLMERHLGRPLSPDEDVHHINGVKHDNRVENLEVLSHAEHTIITPRRSIKGRKLNLSDEERKSRSERLKQLHREGKVALPLMRAGGAS